jgi:Sulfatase
VPAASTPWRRFAAPECLEIYEVGEITRTEPQFHALFSWLTAISGGAGDFPRELTTQLVDIATQTTLPLPPVQAASGTFPARVSWALACSAFLLMTSFFWMNEWPLGNFAYSTAVTGVLIAFVAILTRRVFFATVIASGMVLTVILAANVKLKFMDMLVHAYDLFFYFNSLSTFTYLAAAYPGPTFGLFAMLTGTAVLAALVYRYDGARIGRVTAAAAFLVLGVAAWAGLESTGQRRHMHLYYPNRFLSTFYSSWPETIRTLWQGQLIEAAARAPGLPFGGIGSCATAGRKPHVILIHQESMVPPTLFEGLSFDRSVMPFFRSHDGEVHKLRVETFGGASWLTEFSVLAGVSTYSFGSMRQFVQAFIEGKIRETIPQVMETCGYRNVLFYPMMTNFVSNARFYQSIGLNEIFDMKKQGAQSQAERDRFYYANALDEMGKHFTATDKPLFTFIQTMSGHWPYDYKQFPEVEAAGAGPGASQEVDEYIRRISIAAGDYAWLKSELKRRFPNESFVIMNYGDHQPSATRTLVGIKEETETEDVKLRADSPAFIAYYSIETQNWKAPAMPKFPVLDVPYIGLALLEAARLPLSDAYLERKRLMTECAGRYHSCADEGAILAFHRRLIDSGLMESR